MVRIRSIAVFVPVCSVADMIATEKSWQQQQRHIGEQVTAAHKVAMALQAGFVERGYDVQTTRLVMPSFEEWVLLEEQTDAEVIEYFRGLVATLDELGVNFFNLGPAKSARGRSLVLELLKLGGCLSASVDCTGGGGEGVAQIDTAAILAASEICVGLSQETEGGAGNFRFCASFRCPPGVPFFPSAYGASNSTNFEFALGLECGDVFLRYRNYSNNTTKPIEF